MVGMVDSPPPRDVMARPTKLLRQLSVQAACTVLYNCTAFFGFEVAHTIESDF